MDRIFRYQGTFKQGDAGFGMIAKLASLYVFMESKGINLQEGPIGSDDLLRIPDIFTGRGITRTAKGKPEFSDPNAPKFSITHSGDVWMCLFSKHECGLDYQLMRNAKVEQIAKRYYRAEELEFVQEMGAEGFFKIWARREALGKLAGDGLFAENMPSLLLDKGLFRCIPYQFHDFTFGSGLGACAVSPDENLLVTELVDWIGDFDEY